MNICKSTCTDRIDNKVQTSHTLLAITSELRTSPQTGHFYLPPLTLTHTLTLLKVCSLILLCCLISSDICERSISDTFCLALATSSVFCNNIFQTSSSPLYTIHSLLLHIIYSYIVMLWLVIMMYMKN